MGVIQSDHVPLTTACCVISHIVNARRFITSISYNFNFINSIETKNKSLEIGMESRQNIVKRFAKPKVIGKSQSCYKLSFISFSKCKYLIWKLRKLKLLCQPISAVFSLMMHESVDFRLVEKMCLCVCYATICYVLCFSVFFCVTTASGHYFWIRAKEHIHSTFN